MNILDFFAIFFGFLCDFFGFLWGTIPSLHCCVGHTVWVPEGSEGCYQAGPKGRSRLLVGYKRTEKFQGFLTPRPERLLEGNLEVQGVQKLWNHSKMVVCGSNWLSDIHHPDIHYLRRSSPQTFITPYLKSDMNVRGDECLRWNYQL